jgi:ABC-type phosphate/phosphonate transport system ATPase subunit
VIELLGIGMSSREGGWLLRRVCTTLEAGEITLVLGRDPASRAALLDAITGRRVPEEGRVWIDRTPLLPASRRRVRRLCLDVEAGMALVERRSLFWNVVTPVSGSRALGRLLRLPCRGEREAVQRALARVGLQRRVEEPVSRLSALDGMRLLLARALAAGPRYLVVREPDTALPPGEIGALVSLLRLLVRGDRLGVVVSLAGGVEARRVADRLLVLEDGRMVFHGRVQDREVSPEWWTAGMPGR